MNAWANIGVCIGGIKTCQHPDKDVIPANSCQVGTEILSVWPNIINDKSDGHSGKQENTEPDKILLIRKKEISKGYGNVGKP